jgi:HAD superfamily hydrolase (TIGR01509 family)
VLVISRGAWYKAFCTTLADNGIEPPTLKEYRDRFAGVFLRDELRTYFSDFDEEQITKIEDEYVNNVLKFLDLMNLRQGAKEVLEKLKNLGLKMAIVTNNTPKLAKGIMDHAGIKNYFDFVSTVDGARPKPAPDTILRACEKLGVKPSESVYVGDTVTDVKAGNNAKCYTVIIASELEQDFSGADKIINDLSELIEIVK